MSVIPTGQRCFYFSFNGIIVSVRRKEYSVIIKHHRNSSKGYTPIFIDVKNDKISYICIFLSCQMNALATHSAWYCK